MKIPANIAWRHIVGAGLLEEIGFTMSIFVTDLASTKQAEIINASKMAILIAVFDSRGPELSWLRMQGAPLASDLIPDTMDLEK